MFDFLMLGSILVILYCYFFYPAILVLFNKFFWPKTLRFSGEWPAVSIVIAAYNEEKMIAARLENCLNLDYPADKLEVIIASDGSTDRTNDIVKKYKDQGVVLKDYPDRRGKVNVLNDAVPAVKGEIVIFSDANTMFATDAVKKLVRHFENERIGCVCGRLKFVNAEGSRTAELEGFYWKLETFLKTVEGRFGALLGANGGIFAIRKRLFVECPPDTIVEDFVLPMKILERGYKVVYEPQAVALEESTVHIIQEKERRIRIGAGDFQALFMLLPMLSPLRGFPAFAFWSHKVLRWFGPFFLIIAFISNLFLLHEPFYQFTMTVQGIFYVVALIGQKLSRSDRQKKYFGLCYYFVSMNLALLLGFFRFIRGTQKVAWKRTER